MPSFLVKRKKPLRASEYLGCPGWLFPKSCSFVLAFVRAYTAFRFVQCLRDQVQHEVSLGELFAGSERLALQVTLDALEEFFGNLECHGSAFFSHLNAAFLIFHHVVIVLDEVGDVLTGGLTQPFSFFTDPLM